MSDRFKGGEVGGICDKVRVLVRELTRDFAKDEVWGSLDKTGTADMPEHERLAGLLADAAAEAAFNACKAEIQAGYDDQLKEIQSLIEAWRLSVRKSRGESV